MMLTIDTFKRYGKKNRASKILEPRNRLNCRISAPNKATKMIPGITYRMNHHVTISEFQKRAWVKSVK